MASCDDILSKIEAGVPIRIVQNFFGHERVLIEGGLLPALGRRVGLDHQDMIKVRVALAVRAMPGSGKPAELLERAGISAARITAAARELLG